MERMFGHCGLVCSDCGAFIATEENSDKKRREVAAVWSKEYGRELRPGDINCEGCLSSEGQVFSYCTVCEIRKCGMEREIDS